MVFPPWFWSCAMIFGYHHDFASQLWKSAYCVQFQHLNGRWCRPIQETRAVLEKQHEAVVLKLIAASRGSPCDSTASCLKSQEEHSKLKVQHNRMRILHNMLTVWLEERLAGHGQPIAGVGDHRCWQLVYRAQPDIREPSCADTCTLGGVAWTGSVGDVEPVWSLVPELSQTSVVLAAVRCDWCHLIISILPLSSPFCHPPDCCPPLLPPSHAMPLAVKG